MLVAGHPFKGYSRVVCLGVEAQLGGTNKSPMTALEKEGRDGQGGKEGCPFSPSGPPEEGQCPCKEEEARGRFTAPSKRQPERVGRANHDGKGIKHH